MPTLTIRIGEQGPVQEVDLDLLAGDHASISVDERRGIVRIFNRDKPKSGNVRVQGEHGGLRLVAQFDLMT